MIEPLPDGLMDQFTSVLLKFVTFALHVEVPRTVTCVEEQVTKIEGVEVVVLELLLPHDVRKASDPASASEKRNCFRLGLRPPESNFRSSTRRPPCVMPDSKSPTRQSVLSTARHPHPFEETRTILAAVRPKLRISLKQFRLVAEKVPHPAEWLHPPGYLRGSATCISTPATDRVTSR
jgi:hypothetical protein